MPAADAKRTTRLRREPVEGGIDQGIEDLARAVARKFPMITPSPSFMP